MMLEMQNTLLLVCQGIYPEDVSNTRDTYREKFHHLGAGLNRLCIVSEVDIAKVIASSED